MNPLPNLALEQTRLLDQLDQCGSSPCGQTQVRLAREACRLATRLSQVREEIVHPTLTTLVPWSLLARAVIDGDLIRILIAEILDARPGDLVFSALLDAMERILRGLYEAEDRPAGLWARALQAGLDAELLDKRVGARLRELAGPDEDWMPLMPLALETVRSSVSLCGTVGEPPCGPSLRSDKPESRDGAPVASGTGDPS